jgi:hypothetical protein
LRQLAKDGWFPPPNRGVYELSATITGLLHYYRQSRTDVGAHRAAKLHEEHRKLRIGNDAKERKLVSRDAVLATFTAFARDARALLDQKLQNEYPAAVAGLDVAQARVFGKNLNDAICAAIRQLIEQWRI